MRRLASATITAVLLYAIVSASTYRERRVSSAEPTLCRHPVGVKISSRAYVRCMSAEAVPLRLVAQRVGRGDCRALLSDRRVVRSGHQLTFAGCNVRIGQLPAQSRLVLGLKIDVNRATAADLQLLPRIGRTLAERIVKARAERGRFSVPGDLATVRGIGPATLKLLRPLIAFGTGKPAAPAIGR